MNKLLLLPLLLLTACSKEEPKPIDKANLSGEIKATKAKISTAKGADIIDLRLRLKKAKRLYVIDKGKAYISKDFKDPDSIKLKDVSVRVDGGNITLCGGYNGKNSYGAYVGYTDFFYILDIDKSPHKEILMVNEGDDAKNFKAIAESFCYYAS